MTKTSRANPGQSNNISNGNDLKDSKGLRPMKITAVGDGMVGKTCMLISYTSKTFPNEYVPTVTKMALRLYGGYALAGYAVSDGVSENKKLCQFEFGFDNYADNITVDGQKYNLILWDTAGQEDYERLRPLSYPNTDCFLLCFSVVSRSSYENIYSKWTPEIRHHCPHVPIVLVGTKTDIRDERDREHLSYADGKKMKNKIKAFAYVECSAKLMEGLDEIFIRAIHAVLKKPNTKTQRNCKIL